MPLTTEYGDLARALELHLEAGDSWIVLSHSSVESSVGSSEDSNQKQEQQRSSKAAGIHQITPTFYIDHAFASPSASVSLVSPRVSRKFLPLPRHGG
jgi:hypothetical protein